MCTQYVNVHSIITSRNPSCLSIKPASLNLKPEKPQTPGLLIDKIALTAAMPLLEMRILRMTRFPSRSFPEEEPAGFVGLYRMAWRPLRNPT